MPRQNRFPRSFAFRLTDEDGSYLDDVSAAHGFLPGEWARKVISESLARDFSRRAVRLRVQNAELLREYLTELNHWGNNLNQMARALNSSRLVAEGDLLNVIFEIRQKNQQLTRAILDALGTGEDL
jgi:hypothetical protein